KKRGHLAQEGVKKLVGLVARRIERRFKNAGAAFNFERAGSTAHLWITNQPTGAVTGNIKLGHYSNAAVTRVGNDLAHLVLCVEEAVGTKRMELGKFFTLDAKALVLGEVPMKDV